MWRLCVVVALVISFGACGPMPGYVEDTPPAPAPAKAESPPPTTARGSSVEYEKAQRRDTPEYQPRYKKKRRRRKRRRQREERTTSTRVDKTPAAATGNVQIVKLSGPNTYYLIDRDRKLCFLHHDKTMTQVDCALIPEAKDLASAAPAPAVAPTPPAPAGPPTPAIPAAPPAPADGDSDVSRSNSGAPSTTEKARFQAAYIDIFCDRRSGANASPDTRIDEHGLTAQRYGEIEAWWAEDADAWWRLTNDARRTCAGSR